MGDVVTVPRACKEADIPLSKGRRFLWQYADEMPSPVRVAHWYVYPRSIIDKFRELVSRESRCATGGAR